MKRRNYLRRSSAMRRASAKRLRELDERREIAIDLVAEYGGRPPCDVGPILRDAAIEGRPDCSGWADDLHEVLRRSAGGSPTDRANIMHPCRRCHDWIGAHPAQAKALGLDVSRYPGRRP